MYSYIGTGESFYYFTGDFFYVIRERAAVCVAQSKAVRTAAQSAVSSVKDAVHFEKVVDQTPEATWTVPEEETPEAPAEEESPKQN